MLRSMASFPASLPPHLPAAWAATYKAAPKTAAFLRGEGPRGPLTLSYMEAHAQVHCLEAYLHQRGLRRGAAVAILAENDPIVLCWHLALQHLGAVAILLPADLGPQQLTEMLRFHRPKALLLSRYALYQGFRSPVETYGGEGGLVVVQTDPADELRFTDRLVTLEAAIEQGKDYWRQNQAVIHQNFTSVTAAAPAVKFWAGGELTEWTTASLGELMTAANAIAQRLSPHFPPVLLAPPPHEPLSLLGAIAGTLQRKTLVFSTNELLPPKWQGAPPRNFDAVVPTAVVNQLFRRAGQHFAKHSQRRERRLQKALGHSDRILNRKLKGQTNPWWATQRYNRYRSRVLKPLLHQQFAHVSTLVLDNPSELRRGARVLFQSLRVPVVAGI